MFAQYILAAVLLMGVVSVSATADENGQDRHVGYYYPEPAYKEEYQARANMLPDMDKGRRIDFVVSIVSGMHNRPYPPPYAIFAKGGEAEKMIIVANQAGTLDTLYRAKALLATMTGIARGMPIFREQHVESILTFLDLLKMLGFDRVTVSDGDTFAHQIDIK